MRAVMQIAMARPRIWQEYGAESNLNRKWQARSTTAISGSLQNRPVLVEQPQAQNEGCWCETSERDSHTSIYEGNISDHAWLRASVADALHCRHSTCFQDGLAHKVKQNHKTCFKMVQPNGGASEPHKLSGNDIMLLQ